MRIMVKFSIIIPIYNVERYLETCVNSVLTQTYSDYEVILVDDGSPDRCGELCDHYAESDSRVKVVHKVNGGLSSARNAGLDIAMGEYVIFVDSDDYWDDNMALEHIQKNLAESNADLLVFPAKRFYEDENRFTNILNLEVERDKVRNENINHAVGYLLQNNIYRAAAWNKVVKKSIVDVHNMRFKVGYLSEDMDWCGDLLLYCSKFDFYENSFYVYRQQRKGSITSGKAEKLVSDKIYMCQKGYRQSINLTDKNKSQLLLSYYAYEYAVTLGVSSAVKDKDTLREVRNLKVLLDYDICNKVKQVNRMKKVIGYELTRKALCLFVKIKR